MIRNGIYSTNVKKEKPIARILATVFGILVGLLLIFIIWCAVSFSGEDASYVPQAEQISALKVQLEEQVQTIDALRAENVELKAALDEERKKLEALVKPEETEETSETNEDEGENQ